MKRIARVLIGFILFVLLAYQALVTVQYLSDRYKSKFLSNRNLDAVIRSADTSYGDEIASYISFLRKSIPEHATVLIPSGRGSSAPLNDKYLMQYFLFPRKVEACPSDCNVYIRAPSIYIIAQGDFPPKELIPPFKRRENFSESLGLFLPTR